MVADVRVKSMLFVEIKGAPWKEWVTVTIMVIISWLQAVKTVLLVLGKKYLLLT